MEKKIANELLTSKLMNKGNETIHSEWNILIIRRTHMIIEVHQSYWKEKHRSRKKILSLKQRIKGTQLMDLCIKPNESRRINYHFDLDAHRNVPNKEKHLFCLFYFCFLLFVSFLWALRSCGLFILIHSIEMIKMVCIFQIIWVESHSSIWLIWFERMFSIFFFEEFNSFSWDSIHAIGKSQAMNKFNVM